MTYDDERVIALLKESVPAVPEAPARVDAVRRLASRQRSLAAMQVVGAAAAVVLLVASAAVFARPGGGRRVEPTADPVRAMLAAFLERETVTVETTLAGGGPDPRRDVARSAYRLDGSMQSRQSYPFGELAEERVVDGVTYRMADIGEELPPGKKWIRTSRPRPARAAFVEMLESIARTLRDPRYVRGTSVRGVPVAEYAVTLDDPDVGLPALRATLAVDADGLPRRISWAYDAGELGDVSVTMELFGYDEPVVVAPPPAHEVVSEADVKHVPEGPDAKTELWACTAGRRLTLDDLDACIQAYEERVVDASCSSVYGSPDAWSFRCTDGTTGRSDP